MKKMYHFAVVILLFSLLTQIALPAAAQTLTRGPYLQMGNQTAITIRWRTSVATNSRITWGTAFGTYPNIVDDPASVTEHIVRVSGLTADTKYYYTVGSTTLTLQQTNTNYFITAPLSNAERKIRILAIGDCGNASANQVDAKNSFLSFIGSNNVDGMILLGDNAYTTGLDNEFQTEFFDIYKNDILKYNKLYPAPGNHDYANTQANSGVRNNAYYNNFSMPTAGECGGVPSGTEAYYSFDIGNIHFLSLDSYGKEDANTTRIYDTTGAQVTWIKADLAANTKRWTIAYFHHPPYTKTSHTSDTEQELIDIREKFIRILERNGVDMVLCGHAHGYERSYLLKGFYKATPAAPTLLDADFNKLLYTADSATAKYDGSALSCAYKYNSGTYNHGSVYVVSGSAGQLGGTSPGFPHDAMVYSNATNGGVFYFETDSNRLDAKFISYTAPGNATPVIRDQFTIFKNVNKVTNISVLQNDVLNLTASWRGNYYWPSNNAATTQTVLANTSIPGTYDFTAVDVSGNNCLKDSFHVVVNGALAVSLASFTAALDKDKVLLDWATTQESNSKYFTVERSADGINFSFLGKLTAAGISSTSTRYHLVDEAPLQGINYYRLSQTNTNGAITYYSVQKVLYHNNKNFSAAIINIAKEKVNVIISTAKNDLVKMRVVDMMGKEVLLESIVTNAGANSKNLELKNGVYVLLLSNSSGERWSNKIVVQ
jgi:predicted MPP superfamily phosphohydrolase